MAQILVREVEDSVKSVLKLRAKRNGRSMEAEVREILRDAAKEPAETVGFGTASVALFSGRGVFIDEPLEEFCDGPFLPIDFGD